MKVSGPVNELFSSVVINLKLKLCSFVLVPSLFKREIDAFDSFGIV